MKRCSQEQLSGDADGVYVYGPFARRADLREYMLRGMVDDNEIGLDSDVLSITWGGQ